MASRICSERKELATQIFIMILFRGNLQNFVENTEDMVISIFRFIELFTKCKIALEW